MSDRVKEPGRPVEFGSAQRRRGHHASGLHVVLAILVAVVSGCDVVNPGPVNDEFLNLPSAHQAFVDGSQQKLIESINNVGRGRIPRGPDAHARWRYRHCGYWA